jgi:voltage-gated potassium channel
VDNQDSCADRPEDRHVGYQVFILAVSLWAIGTFVVSAFVEPGSPVHTLLEYVDLFICVVFLVDFLITLATAKNRWKYLVSWGWLDLLSALPMLPAARLGRLARVFRIVRVIRGIRAARLVASLVLQHRAENTVLAATLVASVLTITCAAAMLHFEGHEESSNIKTAEDAVWWAFATITTVGYGDRFPVTTEGRFLAVILMFAGVGLFGTFSAFLASWFIGGMEHEQKSEIAELRQEIRELLARKTE